REFRKRMDEAGFDVRTGADSDTWLVQELGSTVVYPSGGVTTALARGNAIAMTKGLHEGGKAKKMGAVTRANVGQLSIANEYGQRAHKERLEGFLTDERFWSAMDERARFWLEEVFVDAHATCIGSMNIAGRAHQASA